MTERERADSRQRRLRIAEALAGTRRSITVKHGRCRSVIVGRDDADVERLRVAVHELRSRGYVGG